MTCKFILYKIGHVSQYKVSFYWQVDLEAAQRHLNQILSVKPMSWEALAQLIEVQWRRGKLDEAEQAVEAAKLALGDQEDPGKSLSRFVATT